MLRQAHRVGDDSRMPGRIQYDAAKQPLTQGYAFWGRIVLESVREPRRLAFISLSLHDNLKRNLALRGFLIPPLPPFHPPQRHPAES
jgi:hypothetical protein